MTTTCILDVGANSGEFMIPVASRLPGVPVLGIEPIPELLQLLQLKKETLGLDNVQLHGVAIDIAPRQAQFNVARHADCGVSSLLEFDKNALASNNYWATRSDLYFDETIEVEVVRLDSLLERAGFDHVSFIKIDAQGLDLRVLESMGRFLESLDGGMLEASTTRSSALYQEEPLLHDVLNFLQAKGFEPNAIKPNDPACAEVNIFFNRKGVDWADLENRLCLPGVPLYDGRHFWHLPSASPHLPPGDAISQSVQQEIARARHCLAENGAAWSRVFKWQEEVAILRGQLSALVNQVTELSADAKSGKKTRQPF